MQYKALWATDFRYLNDARELNYAWKPFVKSLKRRSSELGEYSEAYAAQLRALKLMGAVDLLGLDDSVYVACFTELKDALSQWSRYGANGYGIALGFDSEAIRSLDVPQFYHSNEGDLIDATAQAHFDNGAYETRPLTAKGFLRKVGYGKKYRDQVVTGLLQNVEQNGGKNGSASLDHKTGNSVFQTSAWIYRIALAKHKSFSDEKEHRITVTEHLGGRSLGQLNALSSLGSPFADLARAPLVTPDVRFRSGGPMMFKPYVVLSFSPAALVKVVTGPSIKHQLVKATIRRILDRNGFRHTEISSSKLPYQT